MTHSFPTRRSSDLFVGSALSDDVALVALDEGYEGRVWRRNVLVASIWWPDLPSLAQWNGFLRGAGRTPMDAVPASAQVAVADAPWHVVQAANLSDILGRHRVLAARVAVALILAALCYPHAALARLEIARA